jgi:general stress protein YciG
LKEENIMTKMQSEKSQNNGEKKNSGKSNAGNFKENPERAAEAGRKGGAQSHSGGRKS